jgi:hypothetical protein
MTLVIESKGLVAVILRPNFGTILGQFCPVSMFPNVHGFPQHEHCYRVTCLCSVSGVTII